MEDWRDSSGCSINFPVSCVQTALCSISGEVEKQYNHIHAITSLTTSEIVSSGLNVSLCLHVFRNVYWASQTDLTCMPEIQKYALSFILPALSIWSS